MNSVKKLRISNLSQVGGVLGSVLVGYGVAGGLDSDSWVGGQAIATPSATLSEQLTPQFVSTPSSDIEKGQSIQVLANSNTPAIQPLPDGTYLFGESSQPATIGSAYMVFDVNGQDAVGAFYMPHSSFDCFRGSFQSDELALTIRDSYEQNVFAYAVPLVADNTIASTQQPTLATLRPEGFHPIAELNETDQHILSTCRAQSW